MLPSSRRCCRASRRRRESTWSLGTAPARAARRGRRAAGRPAPRGGPRVDELVVCANTPGSIRATQPPGIRVLENARPLRLAAHGHLGVAATPGDRVPTSTPHVRPDAGAVAALHDFALTRTHCGIAGPRTVWPDGTWQPTRRDFPTVGAPRVRGARRHARAPYAAATHVPAPRAPACPLPPRPGRRRARRGGLAARRVPPHAARDAGGARRLRRGLPGLPRG